MEKKERFNRAIRVCFSLVFLILITCNAASAERIQGRFSDGKAYSGDYFVATANDADGMRVSSVTVRLNIDKGVSQQFTSTRFSELRSIRGIGPEIRRNCLSKGG